MTISWLDALTPRASALALALVLDALLGEPPNAVHPVAWVGRAISWLTDGALGRGARRELVTGAVVALLVPAACAALSIGVLTSLARWPWLQLCVEAVLLKLSFAVRALLAAGADVARDLRAGDVERARADLRSLCSRDAAGLDAELLAAATVESLAENTSDSFVAPLLYYGAFGLPGAVFYRAVNTLDAMIGYRGRYEYLGKAAARLDDLLNFVPARVTACFVLAAALLSGRDARRGLRVLWRDGARTESPNAGRPMAAMAGVLHVALEKPGHYQLGASGGAADVRAIADASRIVALCAYLSALAAAFAIGVRYAWRG